VTFGLLMAKSRKIKLAHGLDRVAEELSKTDTLIGAAQRPYGFELQFGAYAIVELRLLAEMIDLGASGTPRLFVTDTLSDTHATFESGQGIYKEISRCRRPPASVGARRRSPS
jgi:hypothetical protein